MYNKEEIVNIGKQAYDKVDSVANLAKKYGVAVASIYNWKRLYAQKQGLVKPHEVTNYEAMNEVQLKHELMKKDIEIARLKKGYVVKGGGGKKAFDTIPD